MATVRITGLKKIENMLDQLQKNADEIDGKNFVAFDDLFPATFMRTHSSFNSIQEMFDASPFKGIEFKEIPTAEWNAYVIKTTKFKSWKDMKAAGANQWISKKFMKAVN